MARHRHRGCKTTLATARARKKQQSRLLGLLAATMAVEAEDEEDMISVFLLAYLAWKEQQEWKCFGRWGRRGPYSTEKCEEFFQSLLFHFSERFFRAWFRMSRDSFWKIHSMICDDPIFISTSNRPQRPVYIQLAAFLCRVGAETALKAAAVTAIAEGTVYGYIYRVTKAIRNRRDDHLAWPGEERRKVISSVFEKAGFPGCLGSADGTYIRLRDKPLSNPYAYWCRKKYYAATVDHQGIFTSYEFGWPGSVQDSRVFRNSDIWLRREEYFKPDEYILVDKGYPLTKFSIRPFHDFDLTNNQDEAAIRKRWNRRLSSMRIYVEHGFGRLKGRFPLISGLPGRDMNENYQILEALMITHNILEALGDDPHTIAGYHGKERPFAGPPTQREFEEAERDSSLEGDALYRSGLARRKHLVDLMLRMEEWGLLE